MDDGLLVDHETPASRARPSTKRIGRSTAPLQDDSPSSTNEVTSMARITSAGRTRDFSTLSPSTSRRPTNSCSRATIRGSMRPRSWERSNGAAYPLKQRPESSVATPDGSLNSDRLFSGPVLHYAWEPTQRLRRQGISRMFETRGILYEKLFIAGNRRPAGPLVAHPSRCQIEMDSDNMISRKRRGEKLFH